MTTKVVAADQVTENIHCIYKTYTSWCIWSSHSGCQESGC